MNHLDLVGWINTARYKWAEIMGREIKFKPATFYLGIADHLARVVEGQSLPEPGHSNEGGEEDSGEPRPGPSRETSGERQDRERGEMADSLEKGESQAGTPTPTPKNSNSSGGGTAAHARPQFQRQPTKQDKRTSASRS